MNPIIYDNYFAEEVIPTPLDRVSIRRTLMFVSERIRELFREKLYYNHPSWWLQSESVKLLTDLRNRGAFAEYNLINDDQFMIVAILPRENFSWLQIEIELKTSEKEYEQLLA